MYQRGSWDSAKAARSAGRWEISRASDGPAASKKASAGKQPRHSLRYAYRQNYIEMNKKVIENVCVSYLFIKYMCIYIYRQHIYIYTVYIYIYP